MASVAKCARCRSDKQGCKRTQPYAQRCDRCSEKDFACSANDFVGPKNQAPQKAIERIGQYNQVQPTMRSLSRNISPSSRSQQRRYLPQYAQAPPAITYPRHELASRFPPHTQQSHSTNPELRPGWHLNATPAVPVENIDPRLLHFNPYQVAQGGDDMNNGTLGYEGFPGATSPDMMPPALSTPRVHVPGANGKGRASICAKSKKRQHGRER